MDDATATKIAQNPWSDDYSDEDLRRALAHWRNKVAPLGVGTTKAEWEAKADNISAALEERRVITRAKRQRYGIIAAWAGVIVTAIGIIIVLL